MTASTAKEDLANLTSDIPDLYDTPPLESKINWLAAQAIDSTFAESLLEHFLDKPNFVTASEIDEWATRKEYKIPDPDLIRDIIHIIQIIRDGNGEYDEKPEPAEEVPFIVRLAYSTCTYVTVMAKTKEEAEKTAKEPNSLTEPIIKELLSNLERDSVYDEAYETFPELEE